MVTFSGTQALVAVDVDSGVDFTDAGQYATWLDSFTAQVDSGALDSYVDAWAERTKKKK